MNRVIFGFFLGLLATLAAVAGAHWLSSVTSESEAVTAAKLKLSLGLGGGLGSFLAAVSVGAQVAYLKRNPHSASSFGAMVGGFFAKGLALLAGVFAFHKTGFGEPAAFGIALLGGAGIVTVCGLTAISGAER